MPSPAAPAPYNGLLAGAAIGLGAAACAWVAEALAQGAPLTPASIVHLHSTSGALWLTDLAPVVLAGLGWVAYRPAPPPSPGPAPEPDRVAAPEPEPKPAPPARPQADDAPPLEVLHAIYTSSMDGILVLDASGHIILANPASARIFGHPVETLVGSPVDLVVPRYREQEANWPTIRRTAQDAVMGVDIQVDARHASGDEFPLEIAEITIGAEGQQLRVCQVRDISRLRRTHEQLQDVNANLAALHEQALESSRSKSAFLANMSHELRTPLNAILGYSEMLREELSDRDLEDLDPDLERIHSAGRHLLVLINSILDIAKIEAGRMELYMETVHIQRVIEEQVEQARPQAEKNRNTLQLSCADDIGQMTTDATRLRQILRNVLDNACKFTEGGAITVSVSREQVPGGDLMVFEVTDTGIGMTEEQMSRLFRDFEQGDPSSTRKFGGSGVGLAITRRLCTLLGGTITAQSTEGSGSTFRIELPANTASPMGDDPLPPRVEGAVHVLVVDDDPAVREMLRRTLSREGFVVATASSGEQAIERAKTFKPHVVTLDVMMPDMDGWAVLARLKREPATADLPVVMVSMMDQRRAGYALGAAAYLTKPVDRGLLLETLRLLGTVDPPHVLLVEDEPAVRDLVTRTLTGEGWAVTEAHNGRAALEAVARQRPAAILLDLVMPGMDGFQFLSELDRVEDWRSIPVVVMTSLDLSGDQRRRLEQRVERVLQKGAYTGEELVELVRAKVQHAMRARSTRPE